jgi:hypothetical protein
VIFEDASIMILIPEIETVLILVPRTASGALRRAVAAKYPRSMQPYRHMEADGIPLGYDRWRRIGVVRHPVDRLWSLYKFLQKFDGEHEPAYIESMRRGVERPFDDWVMNNDIVFTQPYDSAGLGRYWPHYTVRHPLPENRKSQFVYLRPDLGTEVVRYDDLVILTDQLGLSLGTFNATVPEPTPTLSDEATKYVCRVFAWDFKVSRAHV